MRSASAGPLSKAKAKEVARLTSAWSSEVHAKLDCHSDESPRQTTRICGCVFVNPRESRTGSVLRHSTSQATPATRLYPIPVITSMRGSVISSIAKRMPSRPSPDSFTPP